MTGEHDRPAPQVSRSSDWKAEHLIYRTWAMSSSSLSRQSFLREEFAFTEGLEIVPDAEFNEKNV